jgi:phage/plasmid-associated DNA primase
LNDGNSEQWEQNLGIINNYITNLYEFMPKIGNLSFVKSVAKWIANKIADKDHDKLFDNCKGYLPVLGNKVVNLRTKTIEERCLSHYFTYEITMNYIPGKKDTRVNHFFESLMLEDNFPPNQPKELTIFLQWLIGYSITGYTVKQIMVVLIGEEGSNGKSILLKLITECFSQITRTADKSVIMN